MNNLRWTADDYRQLSMPHNTINFKKLIRRN